MKNMGFQLKNDAESYSFRKFVKEMFFDSETVMVVISGVPSKEELGTRTAKYSRAPRVLREDQVGYCQAG